jgi:hypothetical protein
MDKSTALDKIKKCLQLAKSANEHEAAAALRQAQKLMALHRVNEVDVLAASVDECDAGAGALRIPARWETMLANTVSDAFGCTVIFARAFESAYWKFIGVGSGAEIAQYAFLVLVRQLRKGRAAFIKSKCKRLKPSSKTRRADLFCDAWVRAVATTAQAMSGQPGDEAAINAYLLQHYPSLRGISSRNRNENRNLRERDWDAVSAGTEAGRRAQLNRAVSGMAEQAMIGQ